MLQKINKCIKTCEIGSRDWLLSEVNCFLVAFGKIRAALFSSVLLWNSLQILCFKTLFTSYIWLANFCVFICLNSFKTGLQWDCIIFINDIRSCSDSTLRLHKPAKACLQISEAIITFKSDIVMSNYSTVLSFLLLCDGWLSCHNFKMNQFVFW